MHRAGSMSLFSGLASIKMQDFSLLEKSFKYYSLKNSSRILSGKFSSDSSSISLTEVLPKVFKGNFEQGW